MVRVYISGQTTTESPTSPEVRKLLLSLSDGDKQAFDQLVPLTEDELRRGVAQKYMRRERADQTFQPTKEEIATALGISPETVRSYWRLTDHGRGGN